MKIKNERENAGIKEILERIEQKQSLVFPSFSEPKVFLSKKKEAKSNSTKEIEQPQETKEKKILEHSLKQNSKSKKRKVVSLNSYATETDSIVKASLQKIDKKFGEFPCNQGPWINLHFKGCRFVYNTENGDGEYKRIYVPLTGKGGREFIHKYKNRILSFFY